MFSWLTLCILHSTLHSQAVKEATLFQATYTLVPKEKADVSYLSCFQSTSSKILQHFLFLRGISTTTVWKGSDLLDPICKAFLSALCFHFAFTTLNALFLLPDWRGWGSHPLLPAFRTEWTFGLCCRVGGKRSPPVQSPGAGALGSVEVSTCFHNLDSKIKTVWSPPFQVLVWHLPRQL